MTMPKYPLHARVNARRREPRKLFSVVRNPDRERRMLSEGWVPSCAEPVVRGVMPFAVIETTLWRWNSRGRKTT